MLFLFVMSEKKNHIIIVLSFFILLVGYFIVRSYSVSAAATYTICASECSFTSLTEAFASTTLAAGDVINVQASYASSSESFPLVFPDGKGVVVDCQSSGAVIGAASSSRVIAKLSNTSTLQNCSLDNVELRAANTDLHAITITGNNFSTSPTSSGMNFFEGNLSNFTISNNTNISYITVVNTSTAGTISGNTFYHDMNDREVISLQSSTNITVQSNTFENHVVKSSGQEYNLISFSGSDFTFATNTITFEVDPISVSTIVDSTSDSAVIHGNIITFPTTSTYPVNAFSLRNNGSSSTSTYIYKNNTVIFPGTSWSAGQDCRGAYFYSTVPNFYVTSTYNLIVGLDESTDCRGFLFGLEGSGAFTEYNDYNGYYNVAHTITNETESTNIVAGSNSKTLKPFFKTNDADASNDTELAPFSPLLDVNGTLDIGAYSAVRRSTVNLNSSGTVDYSSVDATSTSNIGVILRTGDTLNLAAGNYDSFSVSSTAAVSGITISGAGDSTIIDASATSTGGIDISSISALTIRNLAIVASTTTPPLQLTSVSDSTFSNLIFRNSSSTGDPTYAITQAVYSYNGNSYNESAAVGAGENVPFYSSAASDCSLDSITSDSFDITSAVGSATNDWHLALARVDGAGGARITVFVPNNFYNSPAALETDCAGNSIIVERWVTSTFAVSGGEFTYDNSVIEEAGVTLNNGFTDPPTLSQSIIGYAGVKLINASGNTFTSVTSTANTYGIWFSGTSANNTVSSSVFSSNGSYDIKSDSSGVNHIKNSSFDTNSTTISSSGSVKAYYRARALVQSGGTSIESAAVTLTSADGSETASLTTGSDGYTAYSDNLLAFTMDSSSAEETSGGYNPYTVAVAALSGYSANSETENLNTKNQTFSISLSATDQYIPSGRSIPPATSTTSTISLGDEVSTSTPTIIPAPTSTEPIVTSTDQITDKPDPIDAYVFERELELRSYGDDVEVLQTALHNFGFDFEVPIRNYYGIETLLAVRKLQKQFGLPTPGRVGPQTINLLNKLLVDHPELAVRADTVVKHRFTENLRYGVVRYDIPFLQLRLSEMGYFNFPILTNYFGSVTLGAVRQLQEQYDLPTTGFVGPLTRGLLNQLLD